MKKVGLKEIAEKVEVSVALVSYVLNGQAVARQVNKETAEKIIAVAKELNYVPNQIARSLKSQKTNTIGLIVADIKYRFTTGITSAIAAAAGKNNYTVIYGSSDESLEKFSELLQVFINRRVDGLIIVPVEGAAAQIDMLSNSDIPFVLVDRHFPHIPTNNILLDNFDAAYRATDYLVKSWHKNIAFFNLKTDLFHLQERSRGCAEALKDHRIDSHHSILYEVATAGAVQKSISAALDKSSNIDALFFATDTLALEGLKYLNMQKIKVPDDISVFSFDESEAFDLFYCPITHSKQPLEEMGKLAVSTLLQSIDSPDVNRTKTLKAELVKGKSCNEN
ncbi:LacI family DNA-binding transcriptional regulator [Pedobacter sp. PWIIR3]